jgi:hypothetical protein
MSKLENTFMIFLLVVQGTPSCQTIFFTTRKVAMADEVEVAPWLLVYHGRRFLVSPLCMSKRFFSRF